MVISIFEWEERKPFSSSSPYQCLEASSIRMPFVPGLYRNFGFQKIISRASKSCQDAEIVVATLLGLFGAAIAVPGGRLIRQ